VLAQEFAMGEQPIPWVVDVEERLPVRRQTLAPEGEMMLYCRKAHSE
jgi:hypothetical protein